MIFVGLSVTVISLDNTILNIALPTITTEFGATLSEQQWLVDGYVLVFAALLLTMGTFGDRIGRKRALQAGLVLFGIGSLMAALSQSTGALTASRSFMGIAGALMLPATLSIVTTTFTAEERPQAIATWAAIFGLGVGIGPVVGGFLVQNIGWHSVFLINLPVIAVALIGGQIYLGETREPDAPPLDIPGALMSIVGLFALIYGIIEAGVIGWTEPKVLAAFGLAAVVIGLFVWWESRTPYPMLPLRFFRNPAFTGANVTLTMLTFALFGVIFFVPQYFQSVLGHGASVAGLMLLPLAITLTFVSSRSALVSKRLGTKRTVALGISLAAVAFMYMALVYRPGLDYFPWILLGQVVQATGIGLAISPATTAIMSSIPVAKAGVGSAMNDTTRQLGGALGVAVFGTIAGGLYRGGVASLEAGLSPETFTLVSNSIQAALSEHVRGMVSPETYDLIVTTAREAFMLGMIRAFFIGSIIMFITALFALAVLPNVVRGERRTMTMEVAVVTDDGEITPATATESVGD